MKSGYAPANEILSCIQHDGWLAVTEVLGRRGASDVYRRFDLVPIVIARIRNSVYSWVGVEGVAFD